MEPLVLPIIELLRGISNVTTGGLLVLILLSVARLVVLFTRRSLGGTQQLTLAEQPAGQGGRSGKNQAEAEVVPQRLPMRLKAAGNLAAFPCLASRLGIAAFLIAAGLMVVEVFGTKPLLRWSLGRLESRTGIKLTFTQASGGLLSGQMILRQVRIVRENHAKSQFDLTCSRLAIGFSLFDICFGRAGFQNLEIDQVSGNYHRLVAPDDPASLESTRDQPTQNFTIGRLRISNAFIEVIDDTVDGPPVNFPLEVLSLSCIPFRTAHAPYDIIFRSTVTGAIAEKPFSVMTTQSAIGKRTAWQAKGLPIKLARAYLGGPFRWLQSGEFDIDMEQQVRDQQQAPVTLDTRLMLRNIQPGVPPDTKPAVAIAAQLLMTKLQKFPKEKELRFTVNVNPEKFDLTTTQNAGQLLQQFKAAATASLVQTTGVNLEALPEGARKKVDTAVDKAAEDALKLLEKVRERRKAKQKTPTKK